VPLDVPPVVQNDVHHVYHVQQVAQPQPETCQKRWTKAAEVQLLLEAKLFLGAIKGTQ
jgi:hypothetical protein